jgi:hypothetical protein
MIINETKQNKIHLMSKDTDQAHLSDHVATMALLVHVSLDFWVSKSLESRYEEECVEIYCLTISLS